VACYARDVSPREPRRILPERFGPRGIRPRVSIAAAQNVRSASPFPRYLDSRSTMAGRLARPPHRDQLGPRPTSCSACPRQRQRHQPRRSLPADEQGCPDQCTFRIIVRHFEIHGHSFDASVLRACIETDARMVPAGWARAAPSEALRTLASPWHGPGASDGEAVCRSR
jgi:hypothetical protein